MGTDVHALPVKRPRTLKQAEAEIAWLNKQLKDRNFEASVDRTRVRALEEEIEKFKERLDESRQHFADLKERLHDAEVSLARANGYIDRVVDQDAPDTAEAIVPAVGIVGNKPPVLPPRGPGIRHNQRDEVAHDTTYGRAVRRKHWTDY